MTKFGDKYLDLVIGDNINKGGRTLASAGGYSAGVALATLLVPGGPLLIALSLI